MAGTQKARYVTQMPFVGTETQKKLINELATKEGVSQAFVVRKAVNAFFGLTDEGEIPDGGAAIVPRI